MAKRPLLKGFEMLKNLKTINTLTFVIALMFFADAYLVYMNLLRSEGKFEFSLPVKAGILLLVAMGLLGYRGMVIANNNRIESQNYIGVDQIDQTERMVRARAGSSKYR